MEDNEKNCIKLNTDGNLFPNSAVINNIEVKITIYEKEDSNTQDTIIHEIENYRQLIKDKKYEESYNYINSVYDKLVDKIKNYPKTTFDPSHVFCFYPIDVPRKEIIRHFKNQIIEQEIYSDFSDKFYKTDKKKSIKTNSLNREDYVLNIESGTTFDKILIIDDCINEGKTLEIFIVKMLEKNFINKNTQIEMACIYGFKKIDIYKCKDWKK